MIVPVGKNRISERDLFLIGIPGLKDLPHYLDLRSQYFGAFLVCDADRIPDAEIVELAHSLIRQGMAYLCVWGKDCERVHDLFDEVIVGFDPHPTDESVRMTFWLDRVSLDEALWHFLYVAFPADLYWENCSAELIVVVDCDQRAQQIRTRLADQTALSRDVAGEDDE